MITDEIRTAGYIHWIFSLEITMFWKLAILPSSGEIIKPIRMYRLVPCAGTSAIDFILSHLEKCFHYGV
jgi:hypothetical protein